MDKANEIVFLTLLMLSVTLLNGCVSDRQTNPPISATTINEPPSVTPSTTETASTEDLTATSATLSEPTAPRQTTSTEAAETPSTAGMVATTIPETARPDPDAVLLDLDGEKWTYYQGYGFRINRMVYDADYVIQGIVLDVKNPDEDLEEGLQATAMVDGSRKGINVRFVPGQATGDPMGASLYFWGTPLTTTTAGEETTPTRMPTTTNQAAVTTKPVTTTTSGGTNPGKPDPNALVFPVCDIPPAEPQYNGYKFYVTNIEMIQTSERMEYNGIDLAIRKPDGSETEIKLMDDGTVTVNDIHLMLVKGSIDITGGSWCGKGNAASIYVW